MGNRAGFYRKKGKEGKRNKEKVQKYGNRRRGFREGKKMIVMINSKKK